MKKTYKLVVEITGETEEDLSYALDEVKKNVLKGCVSGMDGNDSGDYSFERTTEEVEE